MAEENPNTSTKSIQPQFLRKHSKSRWFENLIGKTFGSLYVVSHDGSTKHGATWNCRCSCGNKKVVTGGDLRSGRMKSCGCGKGWKGDKVGKGVLHRWIRRIKPRPEFCESCGIAAPYDAANISGEYKRDIEDFRWLCRTCHMESDGRLEKFLEYTRNLRGNGGYVGARNPNAKRWLVIDPEGIEYKIDDFVAFCAKHNLVHSRMSTVASGRAPHHKGWKCSRIE